MRGIGDGYVSFPHVRICQSSGILQVALLASHWRVDSSKCCSLCERERLFPRAGAPARASPNTVRNRHSNGTLRSVLEAKLRSHLMQDLKDTSAAHCASSIAAHVLSKPRHTTRRCEYGRRRISCTPFLFAAYLSANSTVKCFHLATALLKLLRVGGVSPNTCPGIGASVPPNRRSPLP